MLAGLAEIGLAEGSAFSFSALDPAPREAIEEGYAAGKARLARVYTTSTIDMNGW